MKSLGRIPSQLPRLQLIALFLVLAPTALASNTWYVDGVNGSDNNVCKTATTACKTIGHAISLASSADTIMVAPATYTENLTINFSLKIIGAGPATTIVDGDQAGSVFTINNAKAHVTISDFTIQNGGSVAYGAGIYSAATLTVNKSTFLRNKTCCGSGGNGGGGIASVGTLTVNRSTFSGNRGSGGGGIMTTGVITKINDSTFSGNSASYGGGIFNCCGSVLAVSNSTFSGNSAPNAAAIFNEENAATTLQNTILANSRGGNCGGGYSGPITSNGYNLSSDNTCNFNGPGDMNNTDPKLGKLGYHGGPTQTIRLLEGSPAIDAGNPNGCTDGNGNLLKTDQRGYARPDKEDTGGCDIGALERQSD